MTSTARASRPGCAGGPIRRSTTSRCSPTFARTPSPPMMSMAQMLPGTSDDRGLRVWGVRVVGGEDVAAEVAGGAAQHGVGVAVAVGGLVELDQQVAALDAVVVPPAGLVRALPGEVQ